MAQPRIHLSRLHVDATLDSDNRTALLNLDAAVSNPTGPISLVVSSRQLRNRAHSLLL